MGANLSQALDNVCKASIPFVIVLFRCSFFDFPNEAVQTIALEDHTGKGSAGQMHHRVVSRFRQQFHT